MDRSDFEEIVTENFPKLMNDSISRLKEFCKSQSGQIQRKPHLVFFFKLLSFWKIKVQLLKIQVKHKNHKNRKKKDVTFKRVPY